MLCLIYTACPDGYTFCAEEGDNCELIGNVAYGSGTSYIYQYNPGTIPCTNDQFGSDPAIGTPKECCSGIKHVFQM